MKFDTKMIRHDPFNETNLIIPGTLISTINKISQQHRQSQKQIISIKLLFLHAQTQSHN